jgi:membrane protein YdbS with pleckstrin-like domain
MRGRFLCSRENTQLRSVNNETMTELIATTRAQFNPLIRPYLVVTIGLTMVSTIIGIPVAIIWFLGLGQWWARHYFEKLECELTDQSIRFRKGILVQVEKTIPLENIQDVTFIEGPILKHYNLSTLKFETAGSSHGAAANMELTGILDAQAFRNMILTKRDALKQRGHAAVTSSATQDSTLAVLQRIEAKLNQIAEGLDRRS